MLESGDKPTGIEAGPRLSSTENSKYQEEITALASSTAVLAEFASFSDTARAIFSSCKNLIGATSGYVAVLSDDGAENNVVFLDSGGRTCLVDPSLPMPIRGLREEAYRSGKPVINNAFADSAWFNKLPKGHMSLENILFIPLKLQGKVIEIGRASCRERV